MTGKKSESNKGPTKRVHRGGAPKGNKNGQKPINWKIVQELAACHCNAEQIAAFVKVHRDTLSNRCQSDNGELLSVYLKRHRQSGKASLLQMLMAKARRGDFGAMKWLSQNWLNYSDKQEVTTELKPVYIERITGEQVALGFEPKAIEGEVIEEDIE